MKQKQKQKQEQGRDLRTRATRKADCVSWPLQACVASPLILTVLLLTLISAKSAVNGVADSVSNRQRTRKSLILGGAE